MKRSTLFTALLISSSLYAVPALAVGPGNFTWNAYDQPFGHPADDVSYTQNVQEDESLSHNPDVVSVSYNPGDGGLSQNQTSPPLTIDGGATAAGVSYISGGVSDSGMQAIDAEQNGYNLKMLFAQRGAYLADVKVTISGNDGKDMLHAMTEGPVLLVKLPPGHYEVNATAPDGAVMTRRINVTGSHLSSYVINYQSI